MTMKAVILLLSSSVAMSQQSGFIETSIGAAFHEINLSDGSRVSTLGEYFSVSAGLRPRHTLSVSGSFRLWSTEEEDDRGDAVEHALFHDFHFTGLSLGLDAQLFLPLMDQGPYVKVGRHCWAVNVQEVFNIWNGNGCSNLLGGGVLLNGDHSNRGAFFAEVLLTRFKHVSSWMLAAGVRF